jgi:hypothetical protein
MRVFLSYRRDDSAGRAGRLVDGLSARIGERNVFHDVRSIAPGVEFHAAVISALQTTDVTIVVIGTDWSTLTGPDGARRLDEPGDYVRLEVASALAAGGPVVPVLVGDAQFPAAAELPEDLRPLLQRQAIEIRDVAWHEDLDSLIDRLAEELSPPNQWWRKRSILSVAAVLLVAIVIGILFVARGSKNKGSSETPPCSPINASWTELHLPTERTATYQTADATNRKIRFTATAAWVTKSASGWRVATDIEVSNESLPVDGTHDDWYVSTDDFDRLIVDGFAGNIVSCFNAVVGTQQLEPGRRAVVRLGFDSATDPSHAELLVAIDGGTPIPIADRRA